MQSEFCIHMDGFLRFGNGLYVPKVSELKNEILRESHDLAYTMHPGNTKMYWDLRENLWCSSMKKEIT